MLSAVRRPIEQRGDAERPAEVDKARPWARSSPADDAARIPSRRHSAVAQRPANGERANTSAMLVATPHPRPAQPRHQLTGINSTLRAMFDVTHSGPPSGLRVCPASSSRHSRRTAARWRPVAPAIADSVASARQLALEASCGNSSAATTKTRAGANAPASARDSSDRGQRPQARADRGGPGRGDQHGQHGHHANRSATTAARMVEPSAAPAMSATRSSRAWPCRPVEQGEQQRASALARQLDNSRHSRRIGVRSSPRVEARLDACAGGVRERRWQCRALTPTDSDDRMSPHACAEGRTGPAGGKMDRRDSMTTRDGLRRASLRWWRPRLQPSGDGESSIITSIASLFLIEL